MGQGESIIFAILSQLFGHGLRSRRQRLIRSAVVSFRSSSYGKGHGDKTGTASLCTGSWKVFRCICPWRKSAEQWRLAAVPGVVSVHDPHIWSVASDKIMLSAHVRVKDLRHWETALADSRSLLNDRYGIDHVTLQPESAGDVNQLAVRRDGSV